MFLLPDEHSSEKICNTTFLFRKVNSKTKWRTRSHCDSLSLSFVQIISSPSTKAHLNVIFF